MQKKKRSEYPVYHIFKLVNIQEYNSHINKRSESRPQHNYYPGAVLHINSSEMATVAFR